MARMCHYDWNVSVCFHMCLAAGHHMFAEQNTACSACLYGKFNKSRTRSLFGMDGKYPIFYPEGSEVTLSLLEQHQMLTKRRCVKVGKNTDGDQSTGGGFEIELFQEHTDMSGFIRNHRITKTKSIARDAATAKEIK